MADDELQYVARPTIPEYPLPDSKGFLRPGVLVNWKHVKDYSMENDAAGDFGALRVELLPCARSSAIDKRTSMSRNLQQANHRHLAIDAYSLYQPQVWKYR